MQLIGAMGHPGGARAVISKRFQSRFNLINFTFPEDTQVKSIFQTLIADKFQVFDEEIKSLGETMTQATLDLYKKVRHRSQSTITNHQPTIHNYNPQSQRGYVLT
jgi:dynein heavy chain